MVLGMIFPYLEFYITNYLSCSISSSCSSKPQGLLPATSHNGASLGGASYFVALIGDELWAFLTQMKDHMFTIFQDQLAMVDEQTERKLKCLPYCNNRSEYKSHEFVLYVQQCNNKMDYMAPYSSEQTGIATSRKRSLPYSYNCTPVWWMDSMPRLYS